MRTQQDEEEERRRNRNLTADPEAWDHKEERVRERQRIYEEEGVGIAHHQPDPGDTMELQDEDIEETDGDDVEDDGSDERRPTQREDRRVDDDDQEEN